MTLLVLVNDNNILVTIKHRKDNILQIIFYSKRQLFCKVIKLISITLDKTVLVRNSNDVKSAPISAILQRLWTWLIQSDLWAITMLYEYLFKYKTSSKLHITARLL